MGLAGQKMGPDGTQHNALTLYWDPSGKRGGFDFRETFIPPQYQNAGKNLPPSVPDGSECKLRFGFVRKSVITL